VNNPLKINKVDRIALKLSRKELKCSKEEQFTSVLSFINLFTVGKPNGELAQGKDSKCCYESDYLKKIENKLKRPETNKFVSANQLLSYL
jgi:hypothetical protein